MKITEVKTVLLTGPSGNDPFLQALRKKRSASFIEIHTDSELIGIGETYAGYQCPELVPSIVEYLSPILVGLEDGEINPRVLWQRMYKCANFWARNGLGVTIIGGIESALWDLKGKMLGVPVYELLGGALHERLPCYATGCASDYPWSELKRKIDVYREAGFNAFKVGAGYHDGAAGKGFVSDSVQAWVDLETEKLDIIRDHAGKDFVVCLDGHMSNVEEGRPWDVGIAKAVLQAMESYNLGFYEEPLHYNDLAGYEELCKSTSIAVAGGEGLTTRQEFAQYAERRAFDVAQPDASWIGIETFVDVARMFAVQEKQVATHAWCSGVGVMSNIHAAFSVPNIAILEIPPLPGPLHTEIYVDGYRFENGFILKPEGPGLGVRLTDETKNKYPFIPGSGEPNPVPGMMDLM